MTPHRAAPRPTAAGVLARAGSDDRVLSWRRLGHGVVGVSVLAVLLGCVGHPPVRPSPPAPTAVPAAASVPEGPSARSADGRATAATPGPVLSAETAASPADLQHDLPRLVEQYETRGLTQASLIIRDPTWGLVVEINPDVLLPASDLYQLFVLWRVQAEIQAGRLREETRLVLGPATDRAQEDGYRLAADGDWITVAAARRSMITESNNTAASLLWQDIGWAALDPMLRARGFTGTTMTVDEQTTTARDVDRFLAGVVAQDLDPVLRPDDYTLMRDLLVAQLLNDYLSTGFPPEAVFAHKTGAVDDALHDVGVLLLPDGRRIFITVLTRGEPEACVAFMQAVAQRTWQALGGPR